MSSSGPVDVHGREAILPAEGEQLFVSALARTTDRLDDRAAGVRVWSRRARAPRISSAAAQDRRQHVVEVVRDPARQLAERLEPARLSQHCASARAR